MKGKEETVLEKAVIDVLQITEAANKNAKDILAKKMPEDFDKLLKEELTKIKDKKESVEESIVDEKKEPVTEGEEEKAGETKESLNEIEKVDLKESSFEDVESAFDDAQPNDEFNVADDSIMMSDIEEELNKMQGIADEVQVQHEEANEDPFERFKALYGEMSGIMNDMEQQKMQTEMNNQFNDHMTTTFGESYSASLGEEKVNTLKEMFIARQKGDPFEKSAAVNENEAAEEKEVEAVDEMHEKVPHGATAPAETGHNTTPSGINEDEAEEEDKRDEDEVVDEGGHGIALSHNKHTGAEVQPRPEFADYKKSKYRYAVQKENWEKRMTSLLNENKSITKAFNANKVTAEEMGEFITEAREAISKYRTQLTEMAVFNTNLAHSNSILLSEELALTVEDKKLIVSEFKNVASITESEEKYKALLEGFTGTEKKSINENLEDKVNDTIEPSSSQTIVEQVNEQTAFGGAKGQIDKILKNMNYQYQK